MKSHTMRDQNKPAIFKGNITALILFALCLSLCNGQHDGAGTFSFASYYSNKMVLQQSPRSAVIWGYSSLIEGEVSAKIETETVTTGSIKPNSYGEGGIWTVKLPPYQPGGPYKVSVEGDEGVLLLRNILFGDVWVCSGSENMRFPLGKIFNSTEELQTIEEYPDIRVKFVISNSRNETLIDFDGRAPMWHALAEHPEKAPNFSALCWLYGKFLYQRLKYPIGLFLTAAHKPTLLDEWASPETIKECQVRRPGNGDELNWREGAAKNDTISNRYNAMIHPLLNMTIYGFIWYQGGANFHRFRNYNCTFTSLVRDWRTKFHQGSIGGTDDQFPFGFVQKSSNVNGTTQVHGLPEIRWYQTAGYGYVPNPLMKNVFMAVTMDLREDKNDTGAPRDKQDVAQRLGIAGMAIAYKQQKISFQGPNPVLVKNNETSRQLEITFDDVLDVRSNRGFEICCSPLSNTTCSYDALWMGATMDVLNADTIALPYNRTLCDKQIRGVRYAWRGQPCKFKKCTLYGLVNNLPAPPFWKVSNFNSPK